jgi:general secretion pathway protein L
MTETLFIRLGSQADDVIHWLVWANAEQEIIASGELPNASELSQLTEKAQTRKVISFVPGCDVLLKSLNVPAKSQKAIRMAVPFMLEDDLAQEVEQLFFAYSDLKPQSGDENCFVAVVEQAQMQQWQLWLTNADIPCKIMMPDVLAMPNVEQTWQAIQLGEQVLLRQGNWQGATFDANLWPILSKTWQEQSPVIHAYSDFSAIETDQELKIENQAAELPLALLAQHANKQKFNLLQGDFQVKTQRSPVVKTWAWAAGLLVCALLLNVVFKSVTLMQVNSELANVEQEITDVYKKAFPKTKRVRVTTIRSQLKRKLAEVGSSTEDKGFLLMLDKLVPAFEQVPQLKPETLKFDSKRQELRMQATASDYQHFEKFKNALEAKKLTVSQGAQNNQGDKISGSFSISDKSKGGRS